MALFSRLRFKWSARNQPARGGVYKHAVEPGSSITMLRYLVLTCLLASALGLNVRRPKTPQLDGRIVGGSDVTIEELPYQLSLQSNGRHICGASVISETVALTASHCVDGATQRETSLRAGTDQVGSGGTVLDAKRIVMNQQYDWFTTDYDVAIIELSGSLTLGSTIKPIGLASDGYVPSAGAPVIVSGWGTLSSGGSSPTQLQVVTVPVVTNDECNAAYDGAITDRMLCAGEAGKDSCQGDSGGPAVEGGVQIGIVSWGNGCALPGYPGVYSSVGSMRDWIRQNAGV